MRKKELVMINVIRVMFFVPYVLAYIISRSLKLKNYEDMPTIAEWFGKLTEE